MYHFAQPKPTTNSFAYKHKIDDSIDVFHSKIILFVHAYVVCIPTSFSMSGSCRHFFDDVIGVTVAFGFFET